jgi:hypothetical protein
MFRAGRLIQPVPFSNPDRVAKLTSKSGLQFGFATKGERRKKGKRKAEEKRKDC